MKIAHPTSESRLSWFFLLSAIVLPFLSAPIASASLITIPDLFNTGVDPSGTPLPDGTLGDPHYTIVSVPGGTTDVRVRTSAGGFPVGPWIGDSSTSAWIGANNAPDLDSPVGVYLVETTFTLPTNYVAGTATISGRWAADDVGLDILLNGNSLVASGDITAGELPTPPTSFTSYTSFDIGPGVAFFQAGTNTLSFQYSNGGFPAGLRVDSLVGTATVVPEPSTVLALLAISVLALVFRRSFFRRSPKHSPA